MHRANLRRVLGLGLNACLVLCLHTLAGCGAHGQHTSEYISEAKIKMAAMKAGVDWQMGQEQFLAGELDKALRSADTSIEIAPGIAKTHLLRGRIMLEKGDLEEARASLNRAAALDPANAEAPYYLGIVHERFRRPEAALGYYRQAMKNDGANAQYVVAASEMLVQLHRLDEAESLLAAPSDSLVHSSAIRHTQGQLAMVRADYPRACALLEEARLLAPDDAAIHESMVQAQFAAGRFAEAEYNIAALLKKRADSDRRDLRHMRAACLRRLDRTGEARSLLLELTTDEAGAGDVRAWIALGEVSAQTQDFARLRIVGARLAAIAPDRPEGYVMRALALQGQGDIEGALAALEPAARLTPADTQALTLKGLLLSDLGRADEARAAFEAARRSNPGDARLGALLRTAGTPAVAAHPGR